MRKISRRYLNIFLFFLLSAHLCRFGCESFCLRLVIVYDALFRSVRIIRVHQGTDRVICHGLSSNRVGNGGRDTYYRRTPRVYRRRFRNESRHLGRRWRRRRRYITDRRTDAKIVRDENGPGEFRRRSPVSYTT